MPRKTHYNGKKKQNNCQGKPAIKPVDGDGGNITKSKKVAKTSQNFKAENKSGRARYALRFSNSKMEVEAKKDIYLPISMGCEKDLEFDSTNLFPSYLDYPKRPKWTYEMSKEELNVKESEYLREFVLKYESSEDVGIYEQNLETWRQLWRVCEMADILLIVVDARFAIAQFPPYLYSHLTKQLKKGVILVLNKCDMLPQNHIKSLIDYFSCTYPEVLVAQFSSGNTRSKWKTDAEMTIQLIDTINKASKIKVNFNEWIQKIEGCTSDSQMDVAGADDNKPSDCSRILTLGTIGHPNVGKSSFINSIMGKKVVSVSKTPGHTKHFQTIYLTKNIVLCDCPGLVFPSITSFPIQVLMGSYPIAQVRNPMSIVGYICQYLDVVKLLHLTIAEASSGEDTWSPYLVCEAFAVKKNFRLKNSGNADVYRGANLLLRQIVAGSIPVIFYLRPKGFTNYDSNSTEVAEQLGVPNMKENIQCTSSSDEDSSDESYKGGDFSNKFASLIVE